jgi:hypothetical protein
LLAQLRLELEQLAAQFVKPFVKSNKNDFENSLLVLAVKQLA